ncbi:MAG: cytochrome c biogenesis protein ResB [Rhodospirillales bacterium]|nr:cytochrome c biogenesis protein ResB [Rhodospirillales bacterium]MCB9996235.1 cytochrome c biogenesis protein ResB [Rhodospirillales bacterium]
MGNLLKQKLFYIANRLAQPAVVFYTLPALMLLLVAGTVAQRTMGLYDAQHLFFSSFILWLGPLPLPGGYTIIGFISLSLLIKFLFFSDWRLQKAGINLAHLGILVLFVGGFLTAFQAKEGFILIPEGQSGTMISDYHQRELVIAKDGMIHSIIPHRHIKTGAQLKSPDLPFTITVEQACRNCTISRREEDAQGVFGMAQFMALSPGELAKEDEANLYGATLTLTGTGEGTDGTYIIFEAMPKPISLSIGEHQYEIIYQKQQRSLPFSLKLEKFEKGMHPGTAMASSYQSDIIVQDGTLSWPVRIEMNKPLRYKGYTFFQSSFAETPGSTATVLAVVKNTGWVFPYIGTALVAAGLLLHILLMARRRKGTA